MKSLLAEKFYLKNNIAAITILIAAIYLVVLPYSISIYRMPETINKISMIYTMMQRILIIPSIVLHTYLYRIYVDKEYKEVVLSLDKGFRLKYCIYNYIIIQILHVPFYIILFLYDYSFINYIYLYCIQIFVLISLHYTLSKLLDSSITCMLILLAYILLFTVVLSNIGLLNIFVIDLRYNDALNNCYLMLMFLGIGIYMEKIKKK